MEASDLRIGNIVECWIMSEKKSDVHIVDADDLKIMQSYDWYKLNPIKLTEEWLLGFGFKNVYGDEWSVSLKGTVLIFELYKETFYYTAGEGIELSKNILYIHQLQNLCFALTNQELI